MRNQTKYFIIVLGALVLFNCSKFKEKYKIEEIDGVKYYKNTGEAAGKYRPTAKLLFKIKGPENVPDSMKGFGYILDVISDYNDNIYILDGDQATIKKYNKSGEFERYFPEQSGNGVDQFQRPTQFALMYDTLIVYDPPGGKYLQYLTSGTFIQSHYLMSGLKPIFLNSDGKTNLSSFAATITQIDSVDYAVNKLCVLNDRLKIEYVVREIRQPFNKDSFFPDILTSYTLKDGLFYIAENLSDAYRIYVADNRGAMQYIIEKEFTKIPYNEYERTQLNEFVTLSGFQPLDSNKVYYKKAINTIEIDKNNKLWTQPSLDRTEVNQDSFYIDIFDKGIFINRTVLDFINGNETYKLKGNRIYVIAEDRKSVRVYDY
ncbi:MAG: hypothetical protein KKD38_00775 [Candidatus Delongbacteria bacterium]|nr:hypothetical protein [Candidatus Delongbacteria bacterium]MCG2761285.1 hypothetical protein [Candidatus Delongbacteria bacterium]